MRIDVPHYTEFDGTPCKYCGKPLYWSCDLESWGHSEGGARMVCDPTGWQRGEKMMYGEPTWWLNKNDYLA